MFETLAYFIGGTVLLTSLALFLLWAAGIINIRGSVTFGKDDK